MARAAQLLTEDDGDYGSPLPAQSVPLQPGQQAASTQHQPQDLAPEFEVVELDENGDQPQHQPDQQQRDQSLAADSGDQPIIDADGQMQPRRRLPKAVQRQRQREGRDRTLQENAQLRAQLEELHRWRQQVEPRFGQIDEQRHRDEIAAVERQISEQTAAYQAAQRRVADAMAAADGDAFTAAMTDRDAALIRGQQLLARKNLLASGSPTGDPADARFVPQSRQEQQPPPQIAVPPSPVVQGYIQDFTQRFPWYGGARASDNDSRVVNALDNAVMADGFQPNTEDYWDELEDRMARYLPHRFADSNQPSASQSNGARAAAQPRQQVGPVRRGPPTAAPSAGAPQLRPNQVMLTQGRKDALRDAGVLDRSDRVVDKAKYNRYLRQFHEFDRAEGVAR